MQAVFYWGGGGETPEDSCNTVSTYLGIFWPLATDWNASKLNLQLSQICQKSGATWSAKKTWPAKKFGQPKKIGQQMCRQARAAASICWKPNKTWDRVLAAVSSALITKKSLHANAPIFLINLLRSCKLISCSSEGDSFYHFKIWLSKRVFLNGLLCERR